MQNAHACTKKVHFSFAEGPPVVIVFAPIRSNFALFVKYRLEVCIAIKL